MRSKKLFLALFATAALFLTACGSPAADDTTPDAPPSESAPFDGSSAEDPQSDAEVEGDEDCFIAIATIPLIEVGLRLAPETQGQLEAEEVERLFSESKPYAADFAAAEKAAYETYYGAAMDAVGSGPDEVQAMLDSPEIKEAIATVSNKLKTMVACY